jgi:hypothetical protein
MFPPKGLHYISNLSTSILHCFDRLQFRTSNAHFDRNPSQPSSKYIQSPSLLRPFSMIVCLLDTEAEFGNCPTRVYSGLASAKLGFGSCQSRQTRVWQLPNPNLAAAKLWFSNCQTRGWLTEINIFGAGDPQHPTPSETRA